MANRKLLSGLFAFSLAAILGTGAGLLAFIGGHAEPMPQRQPNAESVASVGDQIASDAASRAEVIKAWLEPRLADPEGLEIVRITEPRKFLFRTGHVEMGSPGRFVEESRRSVVIVKARYRCKNPFGAKSIMEDFFVIDGGKVIETQHANREGASILINSHWLNQPDSGDIMSVLFDN
jgi:hypothetical protein